MEELDSQIVQIKAMHFPLELYLIKLNKEQIVNSAHWEFGVLPAFGSNEKCRGSHTFKYMYLFSEAPSNPVKDQDTRSRNPGYNLTILLYKQTSLGST